MQPTKDQENYTQLSLDLGLDEETYKKIKDADKEREPEHPYNWTIPLEEIKDGLNSGFTSHSMLIGTPILCSSKSLVNWDEDKGSIWEDEYNTNGAHAITHNNFIYLNSLDAEEIEKEKNNNPLLRYVINYFYYNPKESPNDKKEIIKNLTEFRHPKKWIYDSITNKKTIEELTPLELATCVYHRPYITIKDYWELCFKPIFKKVFTKDGLKELKKLYDNVKPNTGTYITRTIEEDVFKELIEFNQVYYNSPELKNYKDFIESRLKALNTALEEDTKAYNTKLLEIETYLKEFNTTIEKVKEAIASKEGSSYQDLYIRDRELLRYYLAKRNAEELLKRELTEDEERELEFNRHYGDRIEKEEYNYINSIFNSERGTLENFYLELLKLGKLGEIKGFREVSINTNKQILEKANKPKTREGKLNNILEHLLQPQYFYRNEANLIEQEETAKGNIAQYSNNIYNNFIQYRVSFKNITKKELPLYEELIKKINDANENIKVIEAKIKELKFSDIDLELQAQEELKKAKAILEELEKERLEKGYIFINNTPYKAKIPKSSRDINIRLAETPNSVEVIIDNNFIASYPKTFDIDTIKNKKKFTTQGLLSDLTPDKADQLSAYIRLIIKRASNSYNEGLRFTYEELMQRLEIPNRNPGAEIRFLTTILFNVKIKNINLKGGTKGALINSSFIDTFTIDNNEVNIILSPVVREIARLNTSKIWTKDSILTPIEEIIDDKTAQLMNQLSFNETTGETILNRNIAPLTLIRGVNSFNLDTGANNFRANIGQPLANILTSLNNNPDTFYYYNDAMINRVNRATTIADLEEAYKVEFKDTNLIPSKFKHQEEKRKNYLLKHPQGYKKKK